LSTGTPAAGPRGEVWERLQTLPRRFRKQSANGLVAEWELRIGREAYTVAIADHACTVRRGAADRAASTISTASGTWLEIDAGTVTGAQAWLERQVDVTGNLELAVRLQTLFKPFQRPRRARDLDQMEVQLDDLTVSTYLLGRGKPLLLLHGLGASKISWLPVMGRLADRYQLIVPDLPGHGESGKPVTDYSPRFYARILRHLLDELGVDRACVVGNSMGGRVAIEMALRSPTRVLALGLLGAAVPGFRWRRVMGFTRVFPTEVAAIPFPLRQRWMEAALRRLFAESTAVDSHALSAAAREFIRVYRSPRARMAFFSSLRHVVTERPDPFFSSLRRIKHPVLVVYGSHDRLVPPRLAVRLIDHLPHAKALELPSVGHVPQFEAAEPTLSALEDFFDSV
jgi:pimeloyl-ACP methyl ester carboxylesterase